MFGKKKPETFDLTERVKRLSGGRDINHIPWGELVVLLNQAEDERMAEEAQPA